MEDELRRAQLAYLTERLADVEAELEKSEAALGMRINRQNWRALATTVADAVHDGGNPGLAQRYLAALVFTQRSNVTRQPSNR
jgi:hypothetical protein